MNQVESMVFLYLFGCFRMLHFIAYETLLRSRMEVDGAYKRLIAK